MNETPVVSVVIATYNRSQILAHAITSVRRSTYTQWEIIVVGDGCTDDTAAVVSSFADERITFVNLDHNTGGQAAPNNRGIALARGRYIALLNHDDLFLTHHLRAAVDMLDEGRADLVCAPSLVAQPIHSGRPAPGQWRFLLSGVSAEHGYSPFTFYSASSWVFRRGLSARVGPWPPEHKVFVTPSQAWLFRASRAGVRFDFVQTAGVVRLDSGARPDAYVQRSSPEHDALARWIAEDPVCLHTMMSDAAIHAERRALAVSYQMPLQALRRAAAHPLYVVLSAAGVHPLSLNMALLHGRRGGFVRHHAAVTGARRSGSEGPEVGGPPG